VGGVSTGGILHGRVFHGTDSPEEILHVEGSTLLLEEERGGVFVGTIFNRGKFFA